MKFFPLLLLSLSFLISCGNNYGNRVTINDQSIVFYKGSGVTESDARRLGEFLLREGYFDTTTSKSVQLTKDTSAWVVRLVVDKERYGKADPIVSKSARILEMVISEQVFDRQSTRLELVDDDMNRIDNIGPAAYTKDSLSKE